jgi:hypothetical protein
MLENEMKMAVMFDMVWCNKDCNGTSLHGPKKPACSFCLPGRLIAAREYKRKAGNSIYQFMCGGGFFLRPNNLLIQDLVH